MLEPDLVERYGKMTDAERVRALRSIINYDMPPLSILFAVLIILEPKRIQEIFEKLEA